MKKNPKGLMVAGVIALVLGLILKFTGGTPDADPVAQQQCEQKMAANGAGQAFIDRCSEATFAIATTATDAQSAAQAISATNRSEIGGNMLAMFLIGVGLALTVGGFFVRRKPTA